jgi:hypothetical protein
LRGWNPVRACVDQHFFEVLGIGPLIGFTTSGLRASERVSPAIISSDVWQGRFGGRPDCVGQPLSIPSGAVYRVVGVLPRGSVSCSRPISTRCCRRWSLLLMNATICATGACAVWRLP